MERTAHLEDIEVGTSFQSARRTVTEADIVAFAGVSGDFNPLHVDEIFAREQTPFEGRIAHGPLVLSMSYGLASIRDGWKILALVECERRFRAPVYPGDTVWAQLEVLEKRMSSSRAGAGFATLAVAVHSDRGMLVQEGRDVLMIAAREAA
ncbi:MAG TPA: MaoC/PaaZ C-terminal domain-containing protein [Solirubrobacteraceae bacterium]